MVSYLHENEFRVWTSQSFQAKSKLIKSFATKRHYTKVVSHHTQNDHSRRAHSRIHHSANLRRPPPPRPHPHRLHSSLATLSALKPHLSPPSLDLFSAVAFPSRTAIAAADPLPPPLLSPYGAVFTVAALGSDAELIDEAFVSNLSSEPRRVRVLVPPTATPSALVQSLGDGGGRRVLCPVPAVVGLTEPPVGPDFLRELGERNWAPVRVNAYETKWAGSQCAAQVVERFKAGTLDAIVFTSTAEVEGLLKSFKKLGLGWESVKNYCRKLLVAAHGPVTAAGAGMFGVEPDVVSSQFGSFQGVVDSLHAEIFRP